MEKAEARDDNEVILAGMTSSDASEELNDVTDDIELGLHSEELLLFTSSDDRDTFDVILINCVNSLLHQMNLCIREGL